MKRLVSSSVIGFTEQQKAHRCLKLVSVLPIALGLLALSATSTFAQVRMASHFGEANIGGRRVIVHVTVAVPEGANENTIANDALRGQGARPFQPEAFTTTGLMWDDFFDSSISQPEVVLHYNAASAPIDAQAALLEAQYMWNDVGTSRFSFADGVPTNRCPSLVRECPGDQVYDGFNDVGWVAIGGCCTLAVTWYSTTIDEIDQALNTRFPWTTSGGSGYDVETVMGHENGHALGLGHTSVGDSIMQATYAGVHQYLGLDDIRGVTYLYPEPGVTGTIAGTVTSNGVPIAGATVKTLNVPASTTTDASGGFALPGIPDLDVYSITVSATGYKSKTVVGVEVGNVLAIELARGGKKP